MKTSLRTIASAGVAAACVVVLLAGCAPATSPVVDEGTVESCPGEFALYVQKTADLQNQPGTVTEVGVESFSALTGIDPLCVTARAGTRKLPSGAPEPVEYTALIAAESQSFDELIAVAQEQGYVSSAPTEGRTQAKLTKDFTYMSVEQYPGATLGLPELDTPYLVVTSITSEEITRIRESGAPSGG